MADLCHVVGSDLQVGTTGDLALCSGQDESQQRILHRLLTGPGSYIWQLPYGAGLPALVGSICSQQQVASIIRSQLALEASVAATPEPQVTLSSGQIGVVTAAISYTNAQSGSNQMLTLPIGS